MPEPAKDLDARAAAAPAAGRRRRRLDPGSLVTGLFFLGVAAMFLAGGLSGDMVAGPDVVGPSLLVGLGLVGIVRVLTRSRRHRK